MIIYYLELAALVCLVCGLSFTNAALWVHIYRDHYLPTTKRARLARRLARINEEYPHD